MDTPPPAPRENRPPPPPPPKVHVNPGGPKLPRKKAEPAKDVPKPPVKSKQAPAVSIGLRYQNEAPPPPLPPKIQKEKPMNKKEEAKSHKAAKAVAEEPSRKASKARREKRDGKQDESVQTDLEKGVANSRQEAAVRTCAVE